MNHISLFGIAASIPCVIILTSCSQVGLTDSEFQTALQTQFPPYWEIISLEVKERENTGTKVQPNIVTRFHTVVQLKEDVFIDTGILNDINANRQQGITFISQSEVKGKKMDIYGVSNSKLVAEKWQSDFNFDANTTGDFGYPRAFFNGRTIVKDSKEQEEFVVQVKKKIEEEAAALKKAIISRQIFSGERLETGGKSRSFKLSFTSFDESSGIFLGELNYPDANVVLAVEGKLLEPNLSFKANKIIKSNIFFSELYPIFSLDLVSANKLIGKYYRGSADYDYGLKSEQVVLTW